MHHKEDMNFFCTYSPVSRTTIITILALASIYKIGIHEMGGKTTFSYGDLEEKIYMDQLKCFVMPRQEHKVCKLVKRLRGLV